VSTREEQAESRRREGDEQADEQAPEGGWGGRNPPPPSTRWKKGQSGNPGGRRKGAVNLHALLLRELSKDEGRLAEVVVKVMIREAAKGKFPFAKEIFDRLEGKAVERHKIETVTDPDAVDPRQVMAELFASPAARGAVDAKTNGKGKSNGAGPNGSSPGPNGSGNGAS